MSRLLRNPEPGVTLIGTGEKVFGRIRVTIQHDYIGSVDFSATTTEEWKKDCADIASGLRDLAAEFEANGVQHFRMVIAHDMAVATGNEGKA